MIDSNVIDVGYSGVIGADRIMDGDSLYDGEFAPDNQSGNVYGPVAYLAYIPWEQLLPWDGMWDDLPAAHAAAITFDLLTTLGLYVLGLRLRGRALGIALAYAWVAFPYSLFALSTNSNDTLIAALLVWALVAAAMPADEGGARQPRIGGEVRTARAGPAVRDARPAAAVRGRGRADGGDRGRPVPARRRPARLL